MDRLFDTVFVRPPSTDYSRCLSTNPARANIDVGLARVQHREYVSILKEAGIKVVELPVLKGHPDSVFLQDPALVGTRLTIVGRFAESTRRGEEGVLLGDLERRKEEVGAARFIEKPGTLEGGDVLVTEETIFVGESRRTNSEGIRQLAHHVKSFNIRPVKTGLFHLLGACSYLNRKRIILAPNLVSPELFEGFDLIPVTEDEAYAANAVDLGDSKVLIPSGYPKAKRKLLEAGYKPTEVDNSEFRKGDGSLTCLCSPVYKVL